MTNRPVITILIPWNFNRVAKRVQSGARGNQQIQVGGDRAGMRVTASVQDFLRLKLAHQSNELSSAVVGRLRNINIPVQRSRTIHLPGQVTVVEVQARVEPRLARRLLRWVGREASADVLTIYDQEGVGHTVPFEGLRRKGAALVVKAPRGPEGGSRVSQRRARAAEEGKHSGLVEAIRNVWESNGEDMAQLIDYDQSEYEPPEVQDLMIGVLPQYLTEAQLEEWNSLETEVQSKVMNLAFPRNAIRETVETLNRHYDHQTRGASREAASTLQASPDPLDLGLKDPENLVRVNGRGSINHLFT